MSAVLRIQVLYMAENVVPVLLDGTVMATKYSRKLCKLGKA